MINKNEFCDDVTRVALEELGFPIRRIIVKGKEKNIPILLYEAQKWLREEKSIIVLVHHIMTEQGDWEWELSYKYRSKSMYASYESALLEGIKEAVNLLKEERK